MVWVGGTSKPTPPQPLPWAGLPSTSSGCPGLHPTWPWAPPGMGHPQLLWAACASASSPSQWKMSPDISPKSSFSLKPFLLVLSLSTHVKRWFSPCLLAPFMYWKATMSSPRYHPGLCWDMSPTYPPHHISSYQDTHTMPFLKDVGKMWKLDLASCRWWVHCSSFWVIKLVPNILPSCLGGACLWHGGWSP